MSDDKIMRFADVSTQVENPWKGRNRYLVETLDEALADCARATAATGKKSSFTFTLTIAPLGDGEVGLSSTIKAKIPERNALPVRAYLDKRGILVTDDPDQPVLVEIAKKDGAAR